MKHSARVQEMLDTMQYGCVMAGNGIAPAVVGATVERQVAAVAPAVQNNGPAILAPGC